MKEFISTCEEETLRFAKEYAKTLNKGDVLILSGEMGAGKTAFTKGLALGLGITEPVTSPTYAYLNVYGETLYHYDCYRLSCGEDAEALGLTDYFNSPQTICVIEWAENIWDAIPKKHRIIRIEKLDGGKRKITEV